MIADARDSASIYEFAFILSRALSPLPFVLDNAPHS